MKKHLTDNIILILVVGIAILLNMLASRHSHQLDLTFDQRYTLSEATTKILQRLPDPVTIKAYFSEDLPAPYNANSTYVEDLLAQYYHLSNGQVRYQFIDPAQVTDPEAEAAAPQEDLFGRPLRQATNLEKELQGKGIMPVRLRVNEDDKLEERVVYMALELIYGEDSQVIPLIQDLGQLEYNITSTIRLMSREKKPKIALLQGHGELTAENGLAKFLEILGQQYQVEPLDLTGEKATIPDDTAAVIVLSPANAISENELILLDKFMRTGKGLALILDNLRVDMADFSATQVSHGTEQLLDLYGLTLGQGVLGDLQGASIGVQQQQGLFMVNQPVKYYYMPLLMRYPEESIISYGLGPVAMAFASPITVTDKGYPVKIIAQSSAQNWLDPLEDLDLNPLQDWRAKERVRTGKEQPLAVTVDKIPGRLALFGNSYFLTDQFIQESGLSMMLNTVDWLLGDDELLAMRNRGLAMELLDQDISRSRRNFIKYGNIFGGPLCLVVISLLLRGRRNHKRRQLQAPSEGTK